MELENHQLKNNKRNSKKKIKKLKKRKKQEIRLEETNQKKKSMLLQGMLKQKLDKAMDVN